MRNNKSYTAQALAQDARQRTARRESEYSEKPLSFEGLKTVPIAERGGKVRVEQFARPFQKGGGVQQLVDSLPDILAGQAFRGVLDALKRARAE